MVCLARWADKAARARLEDSAHRCPGLSAPCPLPTGTVASKSSPCFAIAASMCCRILIEQGMFGQAELACLESQCHTLVTPLAARLMLRMVLRAGSELELGLELELEWGSASRREACCWSGLRSAAEESKFDFKYFKTCFRLFPL